MDTELKGSDQQIASATGRSRVWAFHVH